MKTLLIFASLLIGSASPCYAGNFDVFGDNSRSCTDWCSSQSNMMSSTGITCESAKLQVGDGWLPITCGGGPSVAGDVMCSCK